MAAKRISKASSSSARNTNQSLVEKVLASEPRIIELAKKHLGELLDAVTRLMELLKSFWKGEYKALPYWTIAMILVPLAYLLSPIDAIPDVIPGIGHLDDAALMAMALKLVGKDLETYEAWKASRGKGRGKQGRKSAKPRASGAAKPPQIRAA